MPHFVKLYFCYSIAYFIVRQFFRSFYYPFINKWWMRMKNLCNHTKRSFVKRIKENTQSLFTFIFSFVLSSPSIRWQPQSLPFLSFFMIHFTTFYIFIWTTLFIYWHNNISFYFIYYYVLNYRLVNTLIIFFNRVNILGNVQTNENCWILSI